MDVATTTTRTTTTKIRDRNRTGMLEGKTLPVLHQAFATAVTSPQLLLSPRPSLASHSSCPLHISHQPHHPPPQRQQTPIARANRSPSRSRRSRSSKRQTSRQTFRRTSSSTSYDDDFFTDQTDISTYVSCNTCCNSIMIVPERLYPNGMQLRCNVCEKTFWASLRQIENADGTPFDAVRFIQIKDMQERAALGQTY